ncbi:Uu.00g117890.m01.CDS01 [Anthostomella pinea]|uniref:Uu.00g117890.m01.CDS01 n=1 Tax=Anthostomella pinea TaxID=933095 RepID=A0AAI8YGW1_9PEZI|nr:Uu.00g117890.m01.CDS01 [Anthostomella pinea]
MNPSTSRATLVCDPSWSPNEKPTAANHRSVSSGDPREEFNRSKAMAITTSATWMCNFVIGLVTPLMLEAIGWGTYIFFAALSAGLRTRGRSLEGMDAVFGDTAAHEEKARLFDIASSMGLTEQLPSEKLDAARVNAEEV